VEGLSIEIKRPPLTTISLWIAEAVTLVLTSYGMFSGVVLALPFSYNYLMVINSIMVGVLEIYVGALIGMHSK